MEVEENKLKILGNLTNSVANNNDDIVENSFNTTLELIHLTLSNNNVISPRVKQCGFSGYSKTVELHKDSTNKSCKSVGIFNCGSLWQCPKCRRKILAERKKEISAIMLQHSKEYGNNSVALVTLTVPHYLNNSLKSLLGSSKGKDGLLGAWKLMITDGAFKDNLLPKNGLLLSSKTLEINYGFNGYHAHFHCLFFFDSDKNKDDLVKIQSELSNIWQRVCVSAGLRQPSLERGVDVRNGTKAGSYVAKLDIVNEVVNDNKKGRHKSKSMNDLALMLVNNEYDDFYTKERIVRVLKEYHRYTKGKKMITWSDKFKLKAKYLYREDLYQQKRLLEVEDFIADEILEIDYPTWKILAKSALISKVKEIYSEHSIKEVADFIALAGIEPKILRTIEPYYNELRKAELYMKRDIELYIPDGENYHFYMINQVALKNIAKGKLSYSGEDPRVNDFISFYNEQNRNLTLV